MPRRPEIIAHRGLPREHPENSLRGFLAALELGVDGIELDVQLTADGIPVVHHDPMLGQPAVAGSLLAGRTTASLTLDELRSHELAPGIGVPTLADVLDAVDARAAVYVEIKAAGAVDAVLALLHGRERWTSVHAFDHRVPQQVATVTAGTATGALSSSYLIDTPRALRAARARDLWQHAPMIDRALVDAVHAAGHRVIAWTVNDPDAMTTLAGFGVDGICTDVARIASAVLR